MKLHCMLHATIWTKQLKLCVRVLLFADDKVVCTGKKEDMKRHLVEMNAEMEKWRMKCIGGKQK